MNPPLIDIAICEDQRPALESLLEALELYPNINVLWTARNGIQALEQLNNHPHPKVILMDIEMPEMNGIEATHDITQQLPDIRIIMLSVFDQEEHLFAALQAGAVGYLLKGERPAEIEKALYAALDGRMPMSPALARQTLAFMRGAHPAAGREKLEDFELSSREVELLEHLAQAKTYQEIADALFISTKTVRNHIHSIYKKLQVQSKAEAVQKALKNRWF